MNLRGIVSVTGKPGLYRVIGQNKAGFILETMDGLKNKLITNASTKLATLEDITFFVKLKISVVFHTLHLPYFLFHVLLLQIHP